MNSRLKNLVRQFDRYAIDAFLVTKDIDVAYLTRFPAAESWLFVTRQKVYYITDFRYILEARQNLKGIIAKRYQQSISEPIIQIASDQNIRRIGFEGRHLTVYDLKRLKRASPKRLKWVETEASVKKLREVKAKEEIALIKKAIKLNLKAFDYIKPFIKPGVTEREILFRLERFVRDHNVAFSFPPIVASGLNSCYPHAKVTRRTIRNNEPVLIDMGIDVLGYKSDLTRMFFLGKIPHLIQKISSCVKEAQQKAIEKIKPGVHTDEIDQQARNYLKKHKLAKYFGHSLGHGVGLEIHEGPTISFANQSILKEGMVFTVEPAVYIPNKFGVRIEDMVLVTKHGCEVLSDGHD